MFKKSSWRSLFLFTFALFLIPNTITADVEVNDCIEETREIVVQYMDGSNSKWDDVLIKIDETKHYTSYQVPDHLTIEEIINEMKEDPNILYVERVRNRCVNNVTREPLFNNQQWYFQSIDYLNSVNYMNHEREVVVAVLDTGIAPHIDLEGKVLPGFDVVNGDQLPEDDNGHGTFVAGIIAANINGTGIAGLTQNVKILPVKIGDAEGTIKSHHIAEGIYYAIEQGADVINMSFGGYYGSTLEYRAIKAAKAQGIILVAATGNDSLNEVAYPSKYPEVISVGAMNQLAYQTTSPEILRANFSNYGIELDVIAPGRDIVSLNHTGGYSIGDGTSYAAPIVSSLAALVIAINPDWNSNVVQWAIERGAMRSAYSEGYWRNQVGYGVVNFTETLRINEYNFEQDAGDLKEQSVNIPVDGAIRDYMHLPNDVDWYTFELPKSTSVDIRLNYPRGDLNLAAEIYDVNGKSLYRVTEVGQSSSINLEKGTYFIKVIDVANRWSDVAYELQVNANLIPELNISEVSYVYVNSSEIRGKGTPGSQVVIKGSQTWEGTVNENGRFNVKIPTQPIGSRLVIKVVDRIGNESSKVVRDVLPFYPDVHSNRAEVLRLSEEGIIRGHRSGYYRPFDNVTLTQGIQTIMSTAQINLIEPTMKDPILNIYPTEYGYEHLATAQQLGWLDVVGQNGRGRLTRGEMALLLYRAFDFSGMGDVEFTDIEEGTELYEAVHVLASHDIIRGYLDQTYRPEEPIRRDHIAVLLARILSQTY